MATNADILCAVNEIGAQMETLGNKMDSLHCGLGGIIEDVEDCNKNTCLEGDKIDRLQDSLNRITKILDADQTA